MRSARGRCQGPAGTLAQNRVRQEGRAGRSVWHESTYQSDPTRGRCRGNEERSYPGKLLASPIHRLAQRFYPSQPRSGIVTFRRTATEGLYSLFLPGDYGYGQPKGPAACSRPGGAGSYLYGGPGGRQCNQSPEKCDGRGSGDPVAGECTRLPKQMHSTVTTWSSDRSGGYRKAGSGMY